MAQVIDQMLLEYGKGQSSGEAATLLQLMIQAAEGEQGWTSKELLAQCVTCKASKYPSKQWRTRSMLTDRRVLCMRVYILLRAGVRSGVSSPDCR